MGLIRERWGATRAYGGHLMSDLFKPVPWTVQNLVAAVQSGALRLPDIQRPFVWEKVKVRDLVDSIYRGFPVGELMFWNIPGDEDTKSIGTDLKTQSAKATIVDGQQRLTSLYVIMTGQPVVDDDYRKERIRIAFNPFAERFEVASPALEKSPDWIPDISAVYASPLKARKSFLERYVVAHDLSEETEERIEGVFAKLHGLKDFSFTVVELQPAVDRERVAEIFVRINSEGVNLTQADFILTWLGVFWDEGRDQLEHFSRTSRLSPDTVSELTGTQTSWTPKNHYIAPDPGKMVRVIVAVGQNRGRLRNAYNALRGRDPRTGEVVPENRMRELESLQQAQIHALDPTNWDDFLRVLGRAGFRSKKMITSDNTVLYTYAVWLIGLTRYKVNRTALRDLMARWFFMSQTTGRYTNSPETRMEEDLARFSDVAFGDADGFVGVLDHVIDTVLTADYWTIRMPDDFVTSSISASPAYQGYLAALNVLDADLFALNGKVKDWMDPSAATIKDVEGHHLFPRAYLGTLGIIDTKRVNQVANFAPTDWVTNNLISDRSPSEYWPELLEKRSLRGVNLQAQSFWHALPENWAALPYEEFLAKRRVLMAAVTRAGFNKLSDPNYQPIVEGVVATTVPDGAMVDVTLMDLVLAGLLKPGDLLIPADPEKTTIAEITDDGLISFNEHTYDTPRRAARADGDEQTDGWEYWLVEDGAAARSLRDLAADCEGKEEIMPDPQDTVTGRQDRFTMQDFKFVEDA